ncbi:hypothetical protein AYL99_08008 [Fonsecaea erecta]|uniref:Uncharacterized protein n=1 Tax=Fonsecaea erecta TaxID=1367422 RepID=A0A178ZBV7_9EURO|nr:hypothetical protein AYL99_08008 [Fonsecaea erecta]OAP57270.1 hypothetical protein AYL99_08008 [Fonsecaea erecta]
MMSTYSDDRSDSSGFADLEEFYERTRGKVSSEVSTRPPSPEASQDDLEVRMEVLVQGPISDSEQLAVINRWLQNGLKVRHTRLQARSPSGDRLTYDLSIPRLVANDPAAWNHLASEPPEIVRNVRVDFTHFTGPYELEGTSGSVAPQQIEELVRSLNNTERLNDDLTRNGRYTKVTVLPIMFEAVEPHLRLEQELNALRDCFVKLFNFHVCDIFKIPEDRPHQNLKRKIDELIRQHGKKDELVIVVYAGHGFNPLDVERGQEGFGPSIWIPRATSESQDGVDWSSIQPSLHSAPCDTLIILNCCFAGNASLGGMKGTNEILAASDRQSVAYAYSRSFLRALIEVLEKLKPSRSNLTINMVRDRLDDYNKNDREVWRRITSPYHKRYPNLDHPSIKLRTLPSSHGPPTKRSAGTMTPSPPYSPSFYVKVSLDSVEHVSLAEWASCFASANYPSDVKLRFYTEESLRAGLGADSAE